MPVFVINADPTFDLTGRARRDGLDLFKDQRLHLIDAVGMQPHNAQIERMWGDWPLRLEGNRNNLRDEVERIISSAGAQRDKTHVILIVLNEFAPTDPSQYVSRDILIEIRQRIQGHDRRDQGVETAESAPNVWVVVFLRPSHNPELTAQRALAENAETLVNNVFVSVFNGRESDRPASDFLTLRVLSELLLDEQEGRRFLQLGVQNAYPVTCIMGPTRLPSGGTSRELGWLLNETLDELEARNAPAAGSTAVGAQAAKLGTLVTQLVAQAKEGVDVQPTIDTAQADQATAGLLDAGARERPAEGDIAATNLTEVADKAAAVRWRPADRFAQLRTRLKDAVERELGEASYRAETWTRRRTEKLKAFSGINVEIGRTINQISRAAVGSRGNDIKVIQDLGTDVCEARNGLKDVAQACREAMSGTQGVTRRTSDLATRVAAARHAFEFELDHVPQLRSVVFYLALSVAGGAIPFLLLALMREPDRLLFAALALILLAIAAFACSTSLLRRRRKLRQAAAFLREELEFWRKCSIEGFNQALKYQTSTLAIGWLTAIAEKLHEIEQSIQLRSDALQDCREMLGTNVDVGQGASHPGQIAHPVATSVEHLQMFTWDKWIVEFLSSAPRPDIRAQARIVMADDGQTRSLAVPGLQQQIAITIRTPQKVSTPGRQVGT